jgi:hypothetical protein
MPTPWFVLTPGLVQFLGKFKITFKFNRIAHTNLTETTQISFLFYRDLPSNCLSFWLVMFYPSSCLLEPKYWYAHPLSFFWLYHSDSQDSITGEDSDVYFTTFCLLKYQVISFIYMSFAFTWYSQYSIFIIQSIRYSITIHHHHMVIIICTYVFYLQCPECPLTRPKSEYHSMNLNVKPPLLQHLT